MATIQQVVFQNEGKIGEMGELMQEGTYYEPEEKPQPGWTGAVDGSGEKPTIQTAKHECCW